MLGAIILASANLTSCKDYDDEIQDLQTQIDGLKPAIEKVKTDLTAEIASLRTQLTNKDAELEAAIQNLVKADEAAAKALSEEVTRATGAEAALEAKINTANEALADLQKLVDGKVNITDFNDEVTKIYGKIAAVDQTLADHMADATKQFGALQKGIDDEVAARVAAVADLQQQIDAIKKWEEKINNIDARLKAVEDTYAKKADLDKLAGELGTTKEELLKKIEANTNLVGTEIKKLSDELTGKLDTLKGELQSQINKINDDLKTINERIDKLGIDTVVAELKQLIADGDRKSMDAADAAQKAADNAQKAADAAKQAAKNAQDAADAAQDAADAAAAAVKAEEAARKAAIAQEVKDRDAAIKAAKDALQETINTLQSTLKTEVARLDAADELMAGDIKTLQTDLQNLSDKVDGIEAFVNALNVLVKGELRSLVFKPDFYYGGIEATKLLSLEYWHFVADKKTGAPIPAANADQAEKKGTTIDNPNSKEANVNYGDQYVARTKHERYDSLKSFKVLNLVANYHMNPSNVAKESILDVSILDNDLEYVPTTRASEAVISVDKSEGKGYNVANGILSVNLKVKDQTKIKSIALDDMVTNFAAVATVRNGKKDTTITSDYAVLRYEQIKDVRLAHSLVNTVAPEKITMTGELNTHCGSCNFQTTYNKKKYAMNGSHLFATVDEAKYFIENTARTSDGINGEGQDTVNWNATLDLSKLVEVHYTTVAGEHEALTAAQIKDYGLEYKFELTKLIIGNNKTSESAQAAINPEDGVTLRPQLPEAKTGKAQAYGADQSRTTINRVPLVRVSLIEKTTGHVLDYGYIPVRISQPATEAPLPPTGVYVEYTSDKTWTHTQYDDCFGAGSTAYGLTTTWIETQYDLMKHNALPEEFSREDFEKNYLDQDGNAGPLYQDPELDEKGTSTLTENPDEAQQYIVKRNSKGEITGYELVKNTAQKIGVITYIPDENLQGTRTSVFKWEVDPETAIELFGKNKSVEIACKLKSQSGTYPDIYVIFKSDPSKINFNKATVTGDVDLDPHKISNYWFSLNSNSIQGDGGLTEFHAQTLTPEDFFEMTADPFDATFADVFIGNFKSTHVQPNSWIKISTKLADGKLIGNHSNYATQKIKTDFIFETAKQVGSFKGYYKTPNKLTTFKLFASDLDQAAVNRLKKVTDKGLDKGKNLYAYVTSPLDAQLIATIEGDDLPTMKIKLVHSKDNAGYIEALLNYKARWELANDVLKAVVSLKAWIELPQSEANPNGGICEIPLTNNSFLVRFLRPINVDSTGKSVQDASYEHGDAPQIIPLEDLLSYTDWRKAWKSVETAEDGTTSGLDYKTFYGIKSVKLQDVEVGENVSTNDDVLTNLGQKDGKWVSLNEVSDNVDFIYIEEGKLQYRNLSNVVDKFQVKLPISVEYYWGTVYQQVTVTIDPTVDNAKKF